jgi:dihydrofolate reductase
MQLTLTTFLTLDGIMQAPGGPDEDRSGGFEDGGWLIPFADDDMGEIIGGIFEQADAFLLGRKTYEIFAGHWPHVPNDNPVAAALNGLPKYVATTTLDSLAWANSRLLGADVAGEVAKLKALPGKELQVHGSGHLAQTLMAHHLIDVFRLFVYPVVLGAGRRLFNDPEAASAFRLTDTRTTGAGMVVLTYEPAGAPQHGSFALDPEPDQHRLLR